GHHRPGLSVLGSGYFPRKHHCPLDCHPACDSTDFAAADLRLVVARRHGNLVASDPDCVGVAGRLTTSLELHARLFDSDLFFPVEPALCGKARTRRTWRMDFRSESESYSYSRALLYALLYGRSETIR